MGEPEEKALFSKVPGSVPVAEPAGKVRRNEYLQSAKWILSRAFLITLALCLLLWNIYLALVMVRLNMNDFGKFYYAAVAFFQGNNIYDLSPAMLIPVSLLEYNVFLNLNPPHFTLLILPLGLFSPLTALLLWSIISLACFLASLFIVFREVKVTFNFWKVVLLAIGILAFAGTSTVVATGQLSFIMMLLVTLFWFESRHARWGRAGVYLGLAMSIKLFLMIFFPYLLLRRRWPAVLAAGWVALSCYGLGVMILGWETYRLWLHDLGLVSWNWASMNASLQGFFSRVLGPSPYFQPVLYQPALIKPLSLLTAGLVGLATLARTCLDKSGNGLDRSYALLLVAAQLISPLGWIYYAWLAFGPMFAVGVSWYKDPYPHLLSVRNFLLFITILGFILPLPAPLYLQPNGFLTLTLGSAYFWATLALWLSLSVLASTGLGVEQRKDNKIGD
jgi:alpha-1,2-mannosyltransferase